MRIVNYVPPQGGIDSKVVIVGGMPGYYENFQKRPFVSSGGSLFRNLLRDNNLHSRVYFTYLIKALDTPMNELIRKVKGEKAEPIISNEGSYYINLFREELKALTEAEVIIPVTDEALYALTGRWGVYKWRGSILKTEYSKAVVIPTIPPDSCVPPMNNYLNRYLIHSDLKRVSEYIKGSLVMDEPKIKVQPSFEEAMEFLGMIEKEGILGKYIGFDIETHMVNKQVTCMSFSVEDYGISIPFVWDMGDYFSHEKEIEIFKRVNDILSNEEITKVIQNAAFDVFMMWKLYKIKTKNYHDTMIAQHTLAPDFNKGLDSICRNHTTLPYYKEDGKLFIMKAYGGWDTLWHYNALDSIVLTIAFPKQEKILKQQGNWETYLRRLRQVDSLIYMQYNGIAVDMDKFRELKETLNNHKEGKLADIMLETGHFLNVNSPKALQEFFYEEQGYKPYRNKKGKITADKAALKRLAKPTQDREANTIASNILEAKSYGKLLSTYLVDSKIDSDNRIRCSYNPCGTLYERLSSSKNIFGTGTNLQNIPHSIMEAFVPEEDSFYASFDLSQAENRIVAYVSNCTTMIKAFERGEDIHSLTAKMIMEVFYNGHIPENVIAETKAPLGDGKLTWRDWGKRANHGLNYDFGYRNFALLYEIAETDARFIVETYHKMYPEIRAIFHTSVRNSIKDKKYVENLMGWKHPFMGALDDSTFKKGYASIPQGTVGGIIAQALEKWSKDPEVFTNAKVLLQIHDQLGFSIKNPRTEEQWITTARILTKIKDFMEVPLTTSFGKVFTIPADLMVGKTLKKNKKGELKGIDFPKTVNEVVKKLKELITWIS